MDILDRDRDAGFFAEDLAFGMGGDLLQQVDRDTLKSATKCSAAVIDGLYRDVYKDPFTDPGESSKRGRLALVRDEGGGHETVRLEGNEARDVLVPVFRDGELSPARTPKEPRMP